MTAVSHQSPWRVGRRALVRWPTKEADGAVYTRGTITTADDRVTLELETSDGRRVGVQRQFARDRLLIETQKHEG